MRISFPLYLSRFVVASSILCCGITAHSQTVGGRGSGNQDIQNREWALTHIAQEVNGHFRSDGKLSLPLIREDFRQLQIANNDLMKRVFVLNLINPKQIMASVVEIKKRATRLRSNLGFGGAKSEVTAKTAGNERSIEKPQLSPALLELDQAVTNFVNSPVFRESKVLDATFVLSSNHDLAEVIRISAVVAGLANQMKRDSKSTTQVSSAVSARK